MSDNILTITDTNFESEVFSDELPILVDFWAPWCGPCKMIAPVLEEVASDYSGKLRIGKYNVDENNKYASEFGIRGIPALIIFKGKNVIGRIVGAVPKSELIKKIDEAISMKH